MPMAAEMAEIGEKAVPLEAARQEAVLAAEPIAKTETEKRPDENLEFKIGGKVFTGVGVVAVICAIGFFLRYAFEVNLINEFGRVALGVLPVLFCWRSVS